MERLLGKSASTLLFYIQNSSCRSLLVKWLHNKYQTHMKPYTPATNKGRTRAGDDIHHRSADLPRAGAKVVAKAARHGARQEARRTAAAESATQNG